MARDGRPSYRRRGGATTGRAAVWTCLSLILALPAFARAQSIPKGVSLHLELVRNTVPTGRVVRVLAHEGVFYVGRDDLRAIGLRLPADAPPWIAPAHIEGVTAAYDRYGQRLLIQAAPELLPPQVVPAGTERTAIRTETATGLALDYDVHSQVTAGESRAAIGTELRWFGRWGALTTRATAGWRDGMRRARVTRHDTTWTYADERRALLYAAGDLVTTSLPWTRALRIAGFSISRQFSLRPDLITHPLPEIGGLAEVPTAVDLIVNGARTARADVAPGPFAFADLPLIQGAGSASIVTTDLLGRRVARTVSFYVARELLQPGLMDFGLAAGALRGSVGTDSWGYAGAAGMGTLRMGLTDFLTGQAHGELGPRTVAGSVGADLRIGRWGVLTSGLSHARQPEGAGWQISAGYRYTAPSFSIQLHHEQRSAAFATVADVPTRAVRPRRVDHLTAGWSFGHRGGVLTGGWFDVRGGEGTRTKFLNVSYTRPLAGVTSVMAGVHVPLAGVGQRATGLFSLILPMGGGSVGLSSTQTSDGRSSRQVQVSRTPPPSGGLGWHAAIADGPQLHSRGEIVMRTRVLEARSGVQRRGNQESVWAGASGAAIVIGGRSALAHRAADAMVLVETSGIGGVPVKLDNRIVGVTNRDGVLLIPGVPSHYAARLSIDPLALPADMLVAEVERRVAVRRQSGAVVRFALERAAGASVRLIEPGGHPVPVGSRAVHEQTGRVVPVGWDGLVYLERLAADNDLHVTRPDGRACRVRFTRPEAREPVLQLGPLVCRP